MIWKKTGVCEILKNFTLYIDDLSYFVVKSSADISTIFCFNQLFISLSLAMANH